MKKIILLLTITLCFSGNLITAQKWVQMMNDPNVNFYEVQKEFYAYWKDRKIEKGHGYKQFKRWEYIMQSRVDANEKLPPAGYAKFKCYSCCHNGWHLQNNQWWNQLDTCKK